MTSMALITVTPGVLSRTLNLVYDGVALILPISFCVKIKKALG